MRINALAFGRVAALGPILTGFGVAALLGPVLGVAAAAGVVVLELVYLWLYRVELDYPRIRVVRHFGLYVVELPLYMMRITASEDELCFTSPQGVMKVSLGQLKSVHYWPRSGLRKLVRSAADFGVELDSETIRELGLDASMLRASFA